MSLFADVYQLSGRGDRSLLLTWQTMATVCVFVRRIESNGICCNREIIETSCCLFFFLLEGEGMFICSEYGAALVSFVFLDL